MQAIQPGMFPHIRQLKCKKITFRTRKLADLYSLGVDIGNRLHSHWVLPQMKKLLHDTALPLVADAITRPLETTGVAAGFSMSADSGTKHGKGFDFHRTKQFHPDLGIPVSAMIHSQALDNKPTDIATQKNAAGAVRSKQNAFDKFSMSKQEVSHNFHGFHGDGQMHNISGGWDISGKMVDEYELNKKWFSQKADICHELERVNKTVCLL